MNPVIPQAEDKNEPYLIPLLSIGIIVLISSAAFVWYSLNSPVKRDRDQTVQASNTEEVNKNTVVPTLIDTPVLEESPQVVCKTKDDYLAAIQSYLPSVVIGVRGESTRIQTATFAKCFAFTEVFSAKNSCPAYVEDLEPECLLSVISTNVMVNYQKEIISGVGGRAEVRKEDWGIDYKKLTASVRELVSSSLSYERVMASKTSTGLSIQAIMDDELPGTDGSFAPKYIEIDSSRQLMFLWAGGKYETFRISGALPEWNPIGVFSILNKSPLAWSNTADKWMPYWMAFTYGKKQGAMLGIHALVYWYPGLQKTGVTKIFESENNIGTPRSTGCMRLKIDEAKYVYEHTNIGDRVIIHE